MRLGYEDDGISQDYLKGRATWIHFVYHDKTRTLRLSPGAPAGQTSQPVHRSLTLRLVTGGAGKTIVYDGKVKEVKL